MAPENEGASKTVQRRVLAVKESEPGKAKVASGDQDVLDDSNNASRLAEAATWDKPRHVKNAKEERGAIANITEYQYLGSGFSYCFDMDGYTGQHLLMTAVELSIQIPTRRASFLERKPPLSATDATWTVVPEVAMSVRSRYVRRNHL